MGRVGDVIERLNNMYTVVEDIISSVARVHRYGGARCCGKKSRDDVSLGQSRVVLDEWLKDIHRQRYWSYLCGRVCDNMTAHG